MVGLFSHAYDFTPLFRRMEKLIETIESPQWNGRTSGGGAIYDRGRSRPVAPKKMNMKKKRIRRSRLL
jgi:hypothetical protein